MGITNSDERIPRRRWARFSLRTLLLFGAIVAVAMSLVVVPAIRQKASREWLDSQRATYSYDATLRSDQSWYVPRRGPPIPSRVIELFGIDLFASVTVVLLDCEEIYDLKPMAGLRNVEEFYINQFIHSSVDFSALQSLRHLQKIEFTEWSGVDRDQLAEISDLLPGVEIVAEEFPGFSSGTAARDAND